MKLIQAQTSLRDYVLDVVSQLAVVRRFRGVAGARAELNRRCKAIADTNIQSANVTALRSAIGQMIVHLDRLAFLILAAYLTKAYSLSLGVFVAAGLYKDLLAQALSASFQLWQQHVMLWPRRLQLDDLFAEFAEERPMRAAGHVTAGHIRLDSVCFRFGTLDPWVLFNVSIEASPGECVLLKGPSGSGKSTILRVACGDLLPVSGVAAVDGVSIQSGVRGLGAVLQVDRLICDSIRENIRFFRRDVSDNDLLEVCDLVGLTGFVNSLPMKLLTPVGEGLTGLSAGQRQRILIARAILKRPPFIILDEATSGLDPVSETELLRRIQDLGSTLILCSHRPGLEQFADRIYEIRGGRAFASSRKRSDAQEAIV